MLRWMMRPLPCLLAAVTLALVVPPALGVKSTLLTRDLAQIARLPFYYGLLSNVGVLAWGISGAVCIFASRLTPSPPEARGFLLSGGLFTLVLAVDDLVLLHDAIGPTYLGLHDEWFYALYGVLLTAFIARYGELMLRSTRYKVLIAALPLLGASVLIDMHWLPGGIDVDDTFKLYGIITYAYYFVSSAFGLLTGGRLAAED